MPPRAGCSSARPQTWCSSRSVTRWPRRPHVRRSTAGNCSMLHIWANVGQVGADFVGIPGATGTLAPEKKPQIAGVFTDLKVAAQPGLSARIDVDTRFITTPSALKLAVMVLGVLSVLVSIVALAILDRDVGSTHIGRLAALPPGRPHHLGSPMSV